MEGDRYGEVILRSCRAESQKPGIKCYHAFNYASRQCSDALVGIYNNIASKNYFRTYSCCDMCVGKL
jgi:hypothetical protein